MLRMDAKTVEKIRDKAADLLRGAQDRWSRTILEDNGTSLGRGSRGAIHARLCLGQGAAGYDRRPLHLVKAGAGGTPSFRLLALHDHFSRLHEVCDLLRSK